MKTRSVHKIPSLIILTIVLLMSSVYLSAQSNDFEISKNLDIYTSLFKELNTNYVDELEPGDLMKSGIDAMLESLDPYTNYIPESEIEDYKFITTGQYGGIGALIHKNGDYVIISEPYKAFPADKANLKAGDRILEVNGKSTVGKSTSDVSKVLKGQPGTSLTLLIERNQEEPFEITVDREQIKVPNIPYYGMLDDGIGYIKLSGFTQNAGREVRKAFVDLQENNELKGIIIDLRGNGGGLLQESVNICNIFVNQGEHIVSTKGKMKERNRNYKTMSQPVDLEIPLVILVNSISASASEIVAGAIQDIDRGVVLGQRTFGKGLVQNVVPLSYNTKMKVTVAKYYIPSGRCIQAIDYSHKDDNGKFTKIPDSLVSAFETRNGRVVYDGGGIEPDVSVDPLEFANITFSLVNKNLLFDYATKYYWEHPNIEIPENFEITDQIYNDFIAYLSDKDYNYISKCEEELEDLKVSAEKENSFEAISDQYFALLDQLNESKKDDLQEYKDEINTVLKQEIVTRYYYHEGRIIASLEDDPEIKKAVELINDPDIYNSLLDGSIVKKDVSTPGE